MKHFIIRYRFKNGSPDEWHRRVRAFIAAIDGDPELAGKISYRCIKTRDGADYYHLAAVADDAAVQALQQREFFKSYSEATRQVAGGEVEVLPLEIVAQTQGAA